MAPAQTGPLDSRGEASLKPFLAKLANGVRLDEAETESAFHIIMSGNASPAQIGGLLMALRARGETLPEILGAARAMRACMVPFAAPPGAIDVCGTGGDSLGTLNISTTVAFVVAGAGVKVAKHGNRAASSGSGASDVLAALGVRLDPPLDRLPLILQEAGCVFLSAPRHHASLRHAASVRSELGVRTLFNLLGPLCNPAGVSRQLTGVFDPAFALPMAQTLAALGSTKSWIVHGGGLDELTLAGTSHVVEQSGQNFRSFTLIPEDVGLERAPISDIVGGNAAHNAAAMSDLLGASGDSSIGPSQLRAYRDTVLLNAAAALVVAGVANDVTAALEPARRSLQSGAALAALDRLRAASEID